MKTLLFALAAAAPVALGCVRHAETPARASADATAGLAPPRFDTALACTDWKKATGPGGEAAREHDSFPELSPERSCFIPIRYGAKGPVPDPIPPGCGYPAGDRTLTELSRRAERYEEIANGTSRDPLPLDLACSLPDPARRAAALANARTLRALARRLARQDRYPYAAVSTFGFGHRAQAESPLVSYLPGDACRPVDKRDMVRFDVNVVRAGRAAEAYFARVAPVVTASGGAVHSPLVEAFLHHHLLTCLFGVPADAILVDPCADHTHTNIRHTGALVRALGGRTAYLVTDDGLQSGYLEEWTIFDLIGGSIDQRSLRDFGHLLGSFRRASVGMTAGYWYTPYRFWAEPEAGLGGFTCIP
jgi:hypothetical protein